MTKEVRRRWQSVQERKQELNPEYQDDFETVGFDLGWDKDWEVIDGDEVLLTTRNRRTAQHYAETGKIKLFNKKK